MTDHPMTAPRDGEGGRDPFATELRHLELALREVERGVKAQADMSTQTSLEWAITTFVSLREKLQPPVTLAGEPSGDLVIGSADWWEREYTDLRDAVLCEFGEYVKDGEEAEGYLLAEGLRSAAAALAASQPPVTIEPSEPFVHPSSTDYLAHFNKVVGNYAEAVFEGRGTEWHARAARSVDFLAKEYTTAASLCDVVSDRCCRAIESAYMNGGDWQSVADQSKAEYPMLTESIDQFLAMLAAASLSETRDEEREVKA